jgi:hypothetical protein
MTEIGSVRDPETARRQTRVPAMRLCELESIRFAVVGFEVLRSRVLDCEVAREASWG